MKHITFKNKLYAPVSTGLFRHFVEVPDVEVFMSDKQPPFYWEGGKIPYILWAQIVSFMKWTQRTFKAEAHCTLFYNPTTKEWAAWAFPQKTLGMTVSLDTADERYKEDRRRFNGDWIMAGSVHHHCTSKAFQSSTDSADEMDKEGIHVTVGKVLDEIVDLHSRKVFSGTMCECKMSEFFAYPEWMANVPRHLQGCIEDDDVLGFVGEVPFPEEWKSRISERTFHTASSHSGATTGQTMTTAGGGTRTLVGGSNHGHQNNGYQHGHATHEQLRRQAERNRAEQVKRQIPEMDKVLDEWAISVAQHHGIDVRTMAKLWLTPESDATELNEQDQALYVSISAMYKNLTINKIKIPLLSIVDHMRALAK